MLNRGEIYFVNLNPTKGREQAGSRPVLIVSSDAINHQPLVVAVVVGISGKNVSRDYPSNVRVTAKESGLREDTVFLCFHPISGPGAFCRSRCRQTKSCRRFAGIQNEGY